VRGIDWFRFPLIAGQCEHGASNFVLGVGRQPAHRFKSSLKQLGY
jgi:hypothetical protein